MWVLKVAQCNCHSEGNVDNVYHMTIRVHDRRLTINKMDGILSINRGRGER